MNGQQVAVEIRRLKPKAPIIMLSGAVDVPEQALMCVDAFIAKRQMPFQWLPNANRGADRAGNRPEPCPAIDEPMGAMCLNTSAVAET